MNNINRRHFFKRTGLGFGAVALQSLLQREGLAASLSSLPQSGLQSVNPLAPKSPMIPPRARRVIYLHMAGAPSQLELFEHKPELEKLHLKDAPPSFLAGKRFAFIKGVPKMLASQFRFSQQGESGHWTSELLPHFSRVIDKTCIIRTVHTDQFNHAPAQLFIHTGSPRLGSPSLGSWVTYGLGSINENLPGFVVLLSGGKTPDGGKSLWGSGFLPSVYQGVQCRTDGDPVLYLSNPAGIDRDTRRRTLDTLGEMNR
ncbi:MAG: DUF1501 domain-containing protein, partial [Acidobacteria bacterium]|nr:DUF1501 domain-containing protein [Acidobacteriota bacterium]